MNITKKRCIECEYCIPEYNHAVCTKFQDENKLYIMPDEYGYCMNLKTEEYIKGFGDNEEDYIDDILEAVGVIDDYEKDNYI